MVSPELAASLGNAQVNDDERSSPLVVHEVTDAFTGCVESHEDPALAGVASEGFIREQSQRLLVRPPQCDHVSHLAVSTMWAGRSVAARACRLVVMPEWQGAGVGMRFLAAICEMMRRGRNRWKRKLTTYFHTSHPGLCMALRRSPTWRQVSCKLYGDHKGKCMRSIAKSARRQGKADHVGSGYGGHFRAVQGFRYLGETR